MEGNKKLEIRKQKVFEYLVIKHPTIEEAEKGKTSEIIVKPQCVCADDESLANTLASRAIPEDQMQFQTRLEVVVRPF